MQKIKINNYKIIRNCEIPLAKLNILTGANSSGKSTIIQALLLLRQSYKQGYMVRPNNRALFLGEENRDFLANPGNADSIFNFNAPRDERISVSIFEQNEVNYGFESRPFAELNQSLSTIEGQFILPSNIDDVSLFNDRFQYLSANRIEPKANFPLLREDRDLGKDGRYAPAYLERYGREKNKKSDDKESDEIDISAQKNPNTVSETLSEQVEKWLGYISPGVRLKITSRTTDIELRYFYSLGNTPTPDILPQNVGFGLTYSLPMITALLAASPGDLLLLENPEAHLHPYGQARIAQLMALVAQNGVQIIVETHSDHIVNGALVACKQFEQNNNVGIDKNNVCIYYFEKKDVECDIKRITILPGGKIDQQPTGFFDQIEKDTTIILGF